MTSQMSLINFLFIYLLMTLTYSLNQATLLLYKLLLIGKWAKLVNWLNSNRLALNVSKTNFVLFSAKTNL